MKNIILFLLLFPSITITAQKKFKNHRFQAEMIALQYFLDSIVPFHNELKNRYLVSQGWIKPTSYLTLFHVIPEYKNLASLYYEEELEWEKNPNKPHVIRGGGRFCPKKFGLKKMKYNPYRLRAAEGEAISLIRVYSIIYDKSTNEKLVIISAELKNGLLDGIGYGVVFAVLDGEIIYKKKHKNTFSN